MTRAIGWRHCCGVKPHEIIFTSGGTEANNLALLGLARRLAPKGKHLISNRAEHHAVLHTLEHLEKREGFEVTWLDISAEGLIDPDELEGAIRPDTTLVSIMTANNETGVDSADGGNFGALQEARRLVAQRHGAVVRKVAEQTWPGSMPPALARTNFTDQKGPAFFISAPVYRSIASNSADPTKASAGRAPRMFRRSSGWRRPPRKRPAEFA